MQYEQSTEQVCTHFVKLKIPMVSCVFIVEGSSVKDAVTASRRCFTLSKKNILKKLICS